MKQKNTYTIYMKDGRFFKIKDVNLKKAIERSGVNQNEIAATRTGDTTKTHRWDKESQTLKKL